MNRPYGPWATLISAGQNPQLSTFWQRRLQMLVPVSQASPAMSRRNVSWLVAVAVCLFLLPTFRPAAADAQQQPVKESDKASQTGGQPAESRGGPLPKAKRRRRFSNTGWPMPRTNGNIAGALIGRLGVWVKYFISLNKSDNENNRKLSEQFEKLLPRFDALQTGRSRMMRCSTTFRPSRQFRWT